VRLSRCPACRTLVQETDVTCSCGANLTTVRIELARLQDPSAYWDGAAPVVSITPFLGLTSETRRNLAAAMRRALKR
jgi:hypothetical protein